MLDFKVERSAPSCRTPRRNADVEQALGHARALSNWAARVHGYFAEQLLPLHRGPALDFGAINSEGIFAPVLPLFEQHAEPEPEPEPEPAAAAVGGAVMSVVASSQSLVTIIGSAADAPDPVVLPVGDMNRFLAEQKRSIVEKFAAGSIIAC